MANEGIPLIGPFLNKLIGSRNERFVKKYTARVEAINELEPKIREMSDQQLREMVVKFREEHDKGSGPEDLMIEAFAVAREAMDRHVGIRSIFNPDHKFDPKTLPESLRELYASTKQRMDEAPVYVPRTWMLQNQHDQRPADGVPDEDDRFLGAADIIRGWQYVEIPLELYEAVRELYPESRPPFRSRPFDVQLIGGMVLAGGKIAEMKTGEGKTIVGPLAAYLAACVRMKVHVVTVNDYLVQRDRDWTFPFFHGLGLTVGAIHPQHVQPEDIKRHMYRCDVVYGTTAEFGFDFLRDNMKRLADQQVQRRRDFAIVDEVDSILIDEARTPLIISGLAREDKPRYDFADQLARHLVEKQKPWAAADKKVRACVETIKGLEGDIRQAKDKGKVPELQARLKDEKAKLIELERDRDQYTQYYEVHDDRKNAYLTHEGTAEAQRKAGLGSFYVDENTDIPHLLQQAVRAHTVYELDRDYVVMNLPDQFSGRPSPSIVIVDTNTGRPMVGRQWSDGLHQAIESKEGVPIKEETQTIASITIQNFFKMYRKLAGMTGTADTEAQEFHDIYGLDVVSIPTNKPVVRRDFPDMVYLRAKDKWEQIVDEIKTFHDVGRPILVGTTSVSKSEMLSQMLTQKHGVKHEVLNAKQHEREGQMITAAGQLGAVMIATNMAGRGTDIKLGSFTREELLEHWLRRGIAPRGVTTEASEQELRAAIYRKIAPNVIADMRKREAEEMDPAQLERAMLEHWAREATYLSDKAIASMGDDELREAISETGRMLIHDIRWFSDIEDLGGLHVIGTERHEARRIDNQLRGRSGRQGDKGSSRFYVSLEDELMQRFGGETMMKILPRLGLKEGDSIESPMLSKRIEAAQKKIEEHMFHSRKQLLEYDEIREHQRQYFYGTRQRVLEGRDVRGLIFEFVEESVSEAVDEYLDPMYPAERAAEYAKNALDCSILPERLKGKDLGEMEQAIRKDAREDARQNIDITLGEYVPIEGSEISVDFDSAGLANWARNRYGVEIDPSELRTGGPEERRHLFTTLCEAADQRIEEADLSGLSEFLQPDYGVHQLVAWSERKFGFKIPPERIKEAIEEDDQTPVDVVMDEAESLYRKREIEYPVDYAMELTMALMRQSPADAAQGLCDWARTRFGYQMDAEKLKTTPPNKVREQLLESSRRFVEENRIEKEINDALACKDDEELDRHLKDRFGVGITDRMRWLEPDRREDAIRARVESILRAELLELERAILLETFDNTWREHLYEMDQLNDSIRFRAFSQQDPRIAFKKEGSRIFTEMLSNIRGRVTDVVFKARISPAAMIQQQMQQRQAQEQAQQQAESRARAAGQQRGIPAGAPLGANIAGPGLPEQAPPPIPEKDRPEAETEKPLSPEEQLEAAKAAREADRAKSRKR